MPFIPHTPEGLLVRNRHSSPNNHNDVDGGGDNDGSNKTCRGVTAKGEPCRRTVAAARTFRYEDGTDAMGDVALYCWQHKDQAQYVVNAVNAVLEEDVHAYSGGRLMRLDARDMPKAKEMNTKKKREDKSTMNAPMLRERSSIDTLVVRLGMIDIDGNAQKKGNGPGPGPAVGRFHHGDPASKRNREEGKEKKKNGIDMVDEKEGYGFARQHYNNKRYSDFGRYDRAHDHRGRPSNRKKSSGSHNWLSTFCLAADSDDDYFEIVRHKSRVADQARRAEMAPQARDNEHARVASQPVSRQFQSYGGEVPQVSGLETQTHLDPISRHLSFIPKSLSPQLASQLFTEMSKPISRSDDEGYIYIFWLTDNKTRASSNTPSSLLSPNNNNNHDRGHNDSNRNTSLDRTSPGRRRMSKNMNNAAAAAAAAADTSPSAPPHHHNRDKPILLKIGRASNVHRRMNEWTRQCDYNLSLLRWYPYSPSISPSTSPSASPSGAGAEARPNATNQTQMYSQRRGSRVQQAQAAPHSPATTTPMNNDSTTIKKVPHVHRVERLIHIELAQQRIKKGACAACGKEHREWFEIESSRTGLQAVDEVVRRWVRWSHDQQRLQQQR